MRENAFGFDLAADLRWRGAVTSWAGLLAGAFTLACGGTVPVPSPPQSADNVCVQRCQEVHAVCVANSTPAHAYGHPLSALIGGLIQQEMSRSRRTECGDVLQGCYATCGQRVTTLEAELASLCAELRCADGSPGFWVGEGNSYGLRVGIGMNLCPGKDGLGGQWACWQVMPTVGCLSEGGSLRGIIDGDSMELTSESVFGEVFSRCEFTGVLTKPGQLNGEYSCTGDMDQSGELVLTQCP